ncbi:UxaA family hydrolase [Halalkalicoccus tibetensis]|uniref:UxaA family hydrolase n=1 Tax=Halalkalicoccus tibetensis TaxID=175632 RepID=A0ABD5VBU6_9EURY
MKGKILDNKALVMHAEDTVATALEDLKPGQKINKDDTTIEISDSIPFGHKFALCPVSAGDPIQKYGEVIGTADKDIHSGAWVHTHNCRSTRGRGDLAANNAASGGKS